VPHPLVGIVMGSQSDWDTLRPAAEVLDALAVPHEIRIVTAPPTGSSPTPRPPSAAACWR
jgi:5-(carboxyamino)imidazole ribonucleotide mutase